MQYCLIIESTALLDRDEEDEVSGFVPFSCIRASEQRQ